MSRFNGEDLSSPLMMTMVPRIPVASLPKRLSLPLMVVGAATALSASRLAESQMPPAPSVQWQPKSAVIAGTGCYLGVDSLITVNGNDVSVVFTNLGVDLGADPPPRFEETRMCQVRLPAKVTRGLAPVEIRELFTYGVRKTAGSFASLSAQSTFFDRPLIMPSVSFPAGSPREGMGLVAESLDTFPRPGAAHTAWCRPDRPEDGMLDARFTVVGKRLGPTDSVAAFAGEFDFRWDVQTTWAPCGQP